MVRDARQQLLVGERLGEEIVTATVERPHAIDRVRLGRAEDDHRDVAVTGAALVQRGRVPEEHEVRSSLDSDHLEAVVRQMPLEKPARLGLGLGEMQRLRHACESSAGMSHDQMSFSAT